MVALAETLREQTGGNAFLLGELWRHLVETGQISAASGGWRMGSPDPDSPDSVREVVGQRLARLTPAARELLSVSAVPGGVLDLDVLRHAWPSDEGSLQDAIGDAVASRVLLESPGSRPTYRFAHELVRRAVYDSLAAQLHLTPEAVDEIESTDTDEDVEWLLAFLSADRLACYCLYQSACPRMI